MFIFILSGLSTFTYFKHNVRTELCCQICGNVASSGEILSTDKWVYLFPLNTLLLSVLLKAKVKVDLLWNICQSDGVTSPAEELCIECEEALCTGCSKVHRNQRLFHSHAILKTEELINKQDVVLHYNSLFHCVKHAQNLLKRYCKTHEYQLCSECFIADHIHCPDVVELTNETPKLLETLSQIKEQINCVEDLLKRFTEINVSHLSKLESQVHYLTCEIREMKKSMNDVLDDLEKRVRMEGERICNEERKRMEHINQSCKSQIMPVRNLNAILESVEMCSTQTQKYLLAKTLVNQISLRQATLQEYYSTNDVFTLKLEISPLLKSVFSISRGDIARLKMKRNDGTIIISDGFKPLKECRAELVKTVEVKHQDAKQAPWYSDVTYVSRDQIMLIDINNKRCYLLNSSTNYITSCVLSASPSKICVVRENEVAVPIPSEKAIQFLSVQDNTITPTRKITTRHICYGIVSVSQEEMIVSGPCGDDKTYYWSLITTEEKENFYHEFDGKGSRQTFVALNTLQTRLYVSVWQDYSVHCFGIDGTKYFTFKHKALGKPQGVALDRDDIVYLVGSLNGNIFQLSPDGSIIQIIVKDVNKDHLGICFDHNGDKFMLTSYEDTNLSVYALKDKDR